MSQTYYCIQFNKGSIAGLLSVLHARNYQETQMLMTRLIEPVLYVEVYIWPCVLWMIVFHGQSLYLHIGSGHRNTIWRLSHCNILFTDIFNIQYFQYFIPFLPIEIFNIQTFTVKLLSLTETLKHQYLILILPNWNVLYSDLLNVLIMFCIIV